MRGRNVREIDVIDLENTNRRNRIRINWQSENLKFLEFYSKIRQRFLRDNNPMFSLFSRRKIENFGFFIGDKAKDV